MLEEPFYFTTRRSELMRLLSCFFYVTYGFANPGSQGGFLIIPTASEAGAVHQATANVNELPSAALSNLA
jgi:hypothetical protein